jgi:hypothetical protein
MSRSFFSCWSSSLSSSMVCHQYTPVMIAMAAVPQAKHTARCRNAALLVLRIWLGVLALLCIAGNRCLALALLGGRGLLLVVLRHGVYEMQLGQAASGYLVRGWGGVGDAIIVYARVVRCDCTARGCSRAKEEWWVRMAGWLSMRLSASSRTSSPAPSQLPRPPTVSLELSKIVVSALAPRQLYDTTPGRRSKYANMKLNVQHMRYLSSDDWRVLTAVCARTPSFCS